jgi:hypothetical protein
MRVLWQEIETNVKRVGFDLFFREDCGSHRKEGRKGCISQLEILNDSKGLSFVE